MDFISGLVSYPPSVTITAVLGPGLQPAESNDVHAGRVLQVVYTALQAGLCFLLPLVWSVHFFDLTHQIHNHYLLLGTCSQLL